MWPYLVNCLNNRRAFDWVKADETRRTILLGGGVVVFRLRARCPEALMACCIMIKAASGELLFGQCMQRAVCFLLAYCSPSRRKNERRRAARQRREISISCGSFGAITLTQQPPLAAAREPLANQPVRNPKSQRMLLYTATASPA